MNEITVLLLLYKAETCNLFSSKGNENVQSTCRVRFAYNLYKCFVVVEFSTLWNITKCGNSFSILFRRKWLFEEFSLYTFYRRQFPTTSRKKSQKRTKDISNKSIHIENIDLKYKWNISAMFIWGQEDIIINVEFTLGCFGTKKILLRERIRRICNFFPPLCYGRKTDS